MARKHEVNVSQSLFTVVTGLIGRQCCCNRSEKIKLVNEGTDQETPVEIRSRSGLRPKCSSPPLPFARHGPTLAW